MSLLNAQPKIGDVDDQAAPGTWTTKQLRGRGRPSSSGYVDDQAALTPKALDGFTTGVGTLSLAIGWTTGTTLSMLGSSAAFPDLLKLFGDTGRGTKWVKKKLRSAVGHYL